MLINQNIAELGVPPTEDGGQALPLSSIEKTVRAIQRLKNYKSPGADVITTELVKYGNDQLHQAIHQLMLEGSMPDDWQRGIIIRRSLARPDNPIRPEHHWPIPKWLHSRQISNRSDFLFAASDGKTAGILYYQLHQLFIDLKAAYDCIVRVKLYRALREFGIPTKFIRLTRLILTNNTKFF